MKSVLEKIEKSICRITIIENKEIKNIYDDGLAIDEKIKIEKDYIYNSEKNIFYPIVSRGSGVLTKIKDTNVIVTAAHVLYGNKPFTEQDNIGNFLAFVEFPLIDKNKVTPFSFGVKNFAPTVIVDNIINNYNIDIAFLAFNLNNGREYFISDLCCDEIYNGKEIIGAGFSSEVRFPIPLSCILQDEDKINSIRHANNNPPIVIKHGHITSKRSLVIHNSNWGDIYSYQYYCDIAMFSGASGGGIFDTDGRLIGIITEKGAWEEEHEIMIKNVFDNKLKYLLDKKLSIKYPVPTATASFLDANLILKSYIECTK